MSLRKLELTWIGKVHAQMQAHYETPAATYGPNRTLSGLVAKYARV